MLILGFILWAWPLIFIVLYIVINHCVRPRKSACVLVLGDIGRSPRMQYHSLSLAKEGYEVDIVGYKGTKSHEDLEENPKIKQHYMLEPPVFVQYTPRLLAYVLKVIWQSASLGIRLLLLPKYGILILQNPPSIPTVVVAVVVCLLRGTFLIIDWHNYGYTILSLALGDKHPLVKFSKWYEGFFGKFSKANLCVTNAMRDDLARRWNIRADTLYDRPSDVFQQASVKETHKLFLKLSNQYTVFKGKTREDDEECTVFTQRTKDGSIRKVPDRPALVVSSTSWTEDEDFGILLKALKDYEEIGKTQSVPGIICVITGKGPQKDYYRQKIETDTWSHVQFCLPWLEAEDYPVLIGSADLGVCLHKSSSGVDLPMKVVDMFGCGLPVCAISYKCLPELVKNGENGLVFSDSEELCLQIQELLKNFPSDQKRLLNMRENLKSFQANRWHDNWRKTVIPLLENVYKPKQS